MNPEPTVLDLVLARLTALTAGHEKLHDSISEVKGELVAVGSTTQQTLAQATKTNGRMDRAEDRLQAVELTLELGAARAEGRREQRRDDLAKVAWVPTFANRWWPVLGLTVLWLSTTGALIWRVAW